MTLPLTRIISGGQTGADQAGLEAGRLLGLKTGGWAPSGYRTDAGRNTNLRDTYYLVEHHSSSYPPRTLLNVIESDATLIFGRADSPGTRYTAETCLEHGRGLIEIYWETGHHSEIINSQSRLDFVVSQLERFNGRDGKKGVRILNVAGNRERTNPGIYDACRRFLITALVDRTSPLHLRTQNNCCEMCGTMIWEAKQGDSTPRFTTDPTKWALALSNCQAKRDLKYENPQAY
jgi:hypothetical protein